MRTERFAYVDQSPVGRLAVLPFLPLNLRCGVAEVETIGLVDSGATVNVLPYDLELRLGLEWRDGESAVSLTGNLAAYDAQPAHLTARIGGFEPIVLGFAWSKNPNVPLILAQVSFFMEFHVCLYGDQHAFELTKI